MGTIRITLLLPSLLLLAGAVVLRQPLLAALAAAVLAAQALLHERWLLRALREGRELLPRLERLQQQHDAGQAERERLLQRAQDAEAALREAEQRYLLAVRGAHDGTWELDLERARLLPSPRWRHLLGLSAELEALPLAAWFDRMHPDDRPQLERSLAEHLAGRSERHELALRLRHADGSWRWLLSRAATIRHASGKPCRVIGLDTDITRLKRVEGIVQAIAGGTAGACGEAFFRSLVEHFARALRVDCAFVTECDARPATRVRTLAVWRHGAPAENFDYPLAGTPCERVIGEQCCLFVRDGLAELYPVECGESSYIGLPLVGRDGAVLGHLAIVHGQPMDEDLLLEAVYRIFTARAAVELELAQALRRLH